jgi:hypothetical protein
MFSGEPLESLQAQLYPIDDPQIYGMQLEQYKSR